MTRSGKTPDETSYVVRRPLLPAGFAGRAIGKTTDRMRSSAGTGVDSVAAALSRGESLAQPFRGLAPLP